MHPYSGTLLGGQGNKELIVVAESIITDTYTDQMPAFKTKSFGKSNYTLIIKS